MTKKLKNLLLWGLVISSLASCVSNRKIAYLQDDERNKKIFIGQDQEYQPKIDTITLQTHDVISVSVDHVQLGPTQTQARIENDDVARLGVRHPFLIGFPLDLDGNIDLPTIGKVSVGGLTVFEAQDAIRDKASAYYANPTVKVFLLSAYVTVLGEVNKPGRYPVFNNLLTVYDALGMASDATDYADRNDVRVIRRRDGKNEIYHLNLNDKDLLASNQLYVQPDDVILVTPLKAKQFIRRDPQTIFNGIATAISAVTLYLLITEE